MDAISTINKIMEREMSNMDLEIQGAFLKDYGYAHGLEINEFFDFQRGYLAATSTYNPFTGCKCKLYESERSLALEAKCEKLERDARMEMRLRDSEIKMLKEKVEELYQPIRKKWDER